MRTLDPKSGEKYGFVRRWCQYMGSFEYYAAEQVALAHQENAPDHAVYPKTEPRSGQRIEGQWVTIDEIRSEAAVHFLYNGCHIDTRPDRWNPKPEKPMSTNGMLL